MTGRLSLGSAAAFALALIVFVFTSPTVNTVHAACGGDCVVPVNGNRYDNHQGGTFHYCFSGDGWTTAQKEAIAEGFSYWPTAMEQNPYAPPLNVEPANGGSCDLFIIQNDFGAENTDVIAAGFGNSDGGSAVIRFNSGFDFEGYTLSNMTAGSFAWAGAHELGHVIGFSHAEGGDCSRDLTIMYATQPPDLGAGPPAVVKCVDVDATNSMYSQGSTEPEVEQDEWGEFICDFHYTITYWVQYWGGSWHVVWSTKTLDYIDNCYPLPT